MKLIKSLTILLLILNVTACVTGTRQVSLEVPSQSVEITKSGAIYIGDIEDKRAFEQKPKKPEIPSVKGKLEDKSTQELSTYIGRQRNGYGMAMGSVALGNGGTVQDEVRKVLTSGLEARGYTVVDEPLNAKQVNVDIKKFWAWNVPSFVSFGFESEVELELESGGKSAELSGKGNNEGQVASNANWALSYKRAYQDLLDKLDLALEKIGL